ncbi:putative nucleotidyltransferase substrate binding domain-containing protein [Dactylosporangium cerinum]
MRQRVRAAAAPRGPSALRTSGTPTSTFIAPKDLDSLTRRHLRETFRAIALVQSRVDRAWLTRLPG